jgi:hypothetical protein
MFTKLFSLALLATAAVAEVYVTGPGESLAVEITKWMLAALGKSTALRSQSGPCTKDAASQSKLHYLSCVWAGRSSRLS